MGALLRLFSSLGITVAVGIVAFFLLGIWVDGKLVEIGYTTKGMARIGCTLFGLGITLYWAYLRIVRHLNTFTGLRRDEGKADESQD